MNEEGYSVERSTDDICFFSSEIIDNFRVVRCLAPSFGAITIIPFTD